MGFINQYALHSAPARTWSLYSLIAAARQR
jgi:hypothetical protein